jgi:hypothetical protein
MSESELIQAIMTSSQIIISIFSMFFTLVSAYIVGLFYFLNRAPIAFKFLAFAMLSVGLIFLGAATMIQQSVQEELFNALGKLPAPAIRSGAFEGGVRELLPARHSIRWLGTILGWLTASASYIALGYMTFLHRWKSSGSV